MIEKKEIDTNSSNEHDISDSLTSDIKSDIPNADSNNIFEELTKNVLEDLGETFINKNLIENPSNVNIYQQISENFTDSIHYISEEKISEEEIIKIKHVYYPIFCYDELLRKLYKNNLVLCYGKKRIGKFTTTLHILSTAFPDKEKIRLYNINNLTHFLNYAKHNICYIIEALTIDLLNQTDYQILDIINSKLHSLNSQLVIIFSVEHISDDLFDKEYLFYITEVESKYNMTLKHINHYKFKELWIKEKILQLLGTVSSIELIQNKLYPKDIEYLLVHLEEEFLLENDVEKSLLTFLEIDIVSNEIRQMLSELKIADSIEFLLFAISLSVLQNYSYREIVRQADQLKAIIVDGQAEPLSTKIIFANTKKAKLEKTKAEIILKPIRKINLSKEIIRFSNPYYANELIKIIWLEYDSLCPKIEIWLNQISSQFNIPIVRTILILLKVDYNYIKSHFIDQWLSVRNRNNQNIMSLLLDSMITDEDLHDYALNMWNYFFDSNDFYLNMIAIHTLGLEYGKEKPKVSVNKLFTFYYINYHDNRSLEYAINIPIKSFKELKEVTNKLTTSLSNLYLLDLDTRRYILKRIAYTLSQIEMYCKGEAILINVSINLFHKETYYKNIKIPTIVSDYHENDEYKACVRAIIYRIMDNLYQKKEIEKILTKYILDYSNIELISSILIYFFKDLLEHCTDIKKEILMDLYKKFLDFDNGNEIFEKIFSNDKEHTNGK